MANNNKNPTKLNVALNKYMQEHEAIHKDATKNIKDIMAIDGWSEEDQLKGIKEHPQVFHLVTNPSYEVQELACTLEYHNIEIIDNPSEKLQLAAINANREAFYYIKTPCLAAWQLSDKLDIELAIDITEEEQLRDLNRGGWGISDYLNPSEKVQMLFMKKGGNIQFIKRPTLAVQIFTVQNCPHQFKSIRNPHPKTIKEFKKMGL